MDITIEQLSTQHPYYPQVYDLREEVLRKPIGLSLDDDDPDADELDTILVAMHGGKVIGCLMLQTTNDPAVTKLRQMAVSPYWQRKGIGSRLVMAAEELLRQKQIGRIILHARVTAAGFYRKLGYAVAGDTFMEVGIQSLVIEATEDPTFFTFYSPGLEGFIGVGHSIEDCIYQAKWGMEEFISILKEKNIPVPKRDPNPTIKIENAKKSLSTV